LYRIAALQRQAANERASFEDASNRTHAIISQLQGVNEQLEESLADSKGKVWSPIRLAMYRPWQTDMADWTNPLGEG
jgi:hypothetical protein